MGNTNQHYGLRPQMSQALKNFVAEKNLPPASALHQAGQFIADPEQWQKVANFLYGHFAENADKSHLKAISEQIEHLLQNSGGVLLIRHTRRDPNGADQTIPHYLGLTVAGTGDSKAMAISDYEDKKRRALTEAPSPTVCTPQNPSGRPVEAPATLNAPPPGFNIGYNAQLAGKIYKVLSKNPRNENNSNVFAQQTIQEDYVFISKEQWQKMR